MRNHSNGQLSPAPRQIANWVARYRASDLSLEQFAKEHGLPRARLHYWVYQKRRSGSSPKPNPVPGFRELPLPELLGRGAWAAEIHLPQGTTVRLAAHTAPAWIGAVVQQLSQPC